VPLDEPPQPARKALRQITPDNLIPADSATFTSSWPLEIFVMHTGCYTVLHRALALMTLGEGVTAASSLIYRDTQTFKPIRYATGKVAIFLQHVSHRVCYSIMFHEWRAHGHYLIFYLLLPKAYLVVPVTFDCIGSLQLRQSSLW
jgi:hypothetical protein